MPLSDLAAEVGVRIGSDRRAELEEVLVNCELQGRLLVRRLELAFRNPGAAASEGELMCPLAPNERVVGYAMDVGGVRREGVVVPRARARAAYEEIVRRMVDPGILEVDEEKGEFRTRVFPIPSGNSKRIWITTLSVIESGEVQIWPDGFGRPARWKMEVGLSGATRPPRAAEWEIEAEEGGNWTMRREGERSVMPGCRINWEADGTLVYRSADPGGADWYGRIVAPHEAAERAQLDTVEFWLDGATRIDRSAGKAVEKLLVWLDNATVRLRVFRETVGEAEEFQVVGGKCEALLERVMAIKRSGMARPANLPWREVEADAVVFLTDGSYPEGPASVRTPPAPMHVVDSGGGKSEWLRARAVGSGGGWHASGRLDPLTARFSGVEEDALVALPGDSLLISWRSDEVGGQPAIEGQAARWLWAAAQCEALRQAGTSQREMDAFRHDHAVLDASSAWLVLETARDYANYGFEPPRNETPLHREWEGFLAAKEEERERDLTALAERWNERCDILAAQQPGPGSAMFNAIAKRVQFWSEQSGLQDDLSIADVRPMIELLTKVSRLAAQPVDAAKGRQLMDCLDKMEQLETILGTKLKVMTITVGGKVRRPGRFTLPVTATLQEAVLAAGGPTEFGAVRRVKLHRNGRSYSYDLRRNDHGRVRIFPGDTIEVPQANWLGNGGGTPGAETPLADGAGGAPVITIEASAWDPTRPYVRVLDDVMKAGGDWRLLYMIQRGAYGWHANFFLDCIELFERRGKMAEARTAARELAELDPDNPAVLRRAARALRRLGEIELGALLFERIFQLSPDDEVACFDFARTVMAAGDSRRAAQLLWEAARIGEDLSRQGRRLVFLEELNGLLARANLDGEALGIDPRFLRHVPLDLRIVFECDAKVNNIVDLVVRDPFGDDSGADWPGAARSSPRYFRSGHVGRGYGPEAFGISHALPGNYTLRARRHGGWDEARTSSVTAELEIARHFGAEREARERFAVRLDEQDDEEVARMRFVPAGWE